MRFVVTGNHWQQVQASDYPTVVLQRDGWDDYGYVTMFRATLLLSQGEYLDLENVKILKKGQERGPQGLGLQDGSFVELPDDYCSLGQALSYYESLLAAGEPVYRSYLVALRDLVFMPEVRNEFAHDPGLETSLLRFGHAERALEDAPALFGDEALAAPRPTRDLSFVYELPGGEASADFSFTQTDVLPSRLAVIIGYNGAGKTRLLAKLAMLAYHDNQESLEPAFVSENGRFVGQSPTFGAVVAVSYSAFDDFALPGTGAGGAYEASDERISSSEASARNYTYCGLRTIDETGAVRKSLKSIEQLTDEFHAAHEKALAKDRLNSLRAALGPVYSEPSFRTIAALPEIEAGDEAWRTTFARLSTGHKIVLNIVMHLCATLERNSLVLIDEPELHLHPPLLAALLRSVGEALSLHDSYAVIATHSPVVLQEVPARNVKVLRRNDDEVVVEPPELQTFAENIGLLTTHVFNLDSSRTDYQGTLRRLAEERTLEEIEDLFGGQMSSQARSLVMSLQRTDTHGPDAPA